MASSGLTARAERRLAPCWARWSCLACGLKHSFRPALESKFRDYYYANIGTSLLTVAVVGVVLNVYKIVLGIVLVEPNVCVRGVPARSTASTLVLAAYGPVSKLNYSVSTLKKNYPKFTIQKCTSAPHHTIPYTVFHERT